jgi:hypothetical protein
LGGRLLRGIPTARAGVPWPIVNHIHLIVMITFFWT